MTSATKVPPKTNQKFTVFVTYNGVTKEFTVLGTQTVQSLLEHSMNDFGVQQNRHIQALFPEQGEELKDSLSLSQAGVGPEEHLLLRGSAVKGGTGARVES